MEYCQTIDEIVHPAAREVLRLMECTRGIEIHHDGDLPARSGMGTSSAFTVGLLNAMYALKGQMPGKQKLAEESIYLEQEILKETVGSQDQALAAYGGLNRINFLPNGEISVTPITISADRVRELNNHLMLFYTGIKRTASDIAQSYVNGIENKKRQLRIMKDLVDESVSLLTGRDDINGFGELLYEAWQAKRSLSAAVSNPEVDDLFDVALSAGAIGGKLTGAGGGGFLLLFVPPSRHQAVKDRLRALIHVPFKFEFLGSQIIFCDREQDYLSEEVSRDQRTLVPFRELSEHCAAATAVAAGEFHARSADGAIS
jgi:D-glycero-alpha-D-manno-heptose-7-phosphate kinase